MLKKTIGLFLLCGFVLFTGKGIYLLRDGWSPRKIAPFSFPSSQGISPEVASLLSQNFHYLGRGRQCFAFASEDGEYVLKFPRTDIYTLSFGLRTLPLWQYREKVERAKRKKQAFVLESFRIAKEELAEETQTIAIHLGKTISPSPSIRKQQLTCIDSLGIPHHFSLEDTSFILQYRKPLWDSLFLQARQEGNREEQIKLLHALVDLLKARGRKGVLNRDDAFLKNYAFDGEKAYQIDVGDFFHLPEADRDYLLQKSVQDSLVTVKEWIAKKDPLLLPILEEQSKSVSL